MINTLFFDKNITTSDHVNNLPKATRAFNAAVAAGVADKVTYNAYITASDRAGNFPEAKRAFNAAVAAYAGIDAKSNTPRHSKP